MRFDRDPERSPSPILPLSDDEDIHDDVDNEAELLESLAEKEAELNRTQELINERNRQVETALAELRQINNLLTEFQTLAHTNVNSKS